MAMIRAVATVTGVRLALPARPDLLLEMLPCTTRSPFSRVRIGAFGRPDRLLRLILQRLWPQWRDALVVVQPATVDRWYRDQINRRWWRRSRRPGRPCINSECRELFGRLAEENGAPRIHCEHPGCHSHSLFTRAGPCD
jgi:hypothetical protein